MAKYCPDALKVLRRLCNIIDMFKKVFRKRPGKKQINYRREKILLMREQTILSKERTILSFMRTGLASIGAGVVLINIFSSSPSSIIIGWAFVLSGIVEILESYRRLRLYQKKMDRISRELGE
jgi:uncharacterized membrane protein YidH (DUF202 family)